MDHARLVGWLDNPSVRYVACPQGIHRVMDFKRLMNYLSKHRRICNIEKVWENIISMLIIIENF
jgi:hypothetical protein